jgi:hypothetical protein
MSSSAPAEPATPTGLLAAPTPAATAEATSSSATSRTSAADTLLCANCGAPLGGKYCSRCGQRHHEHPVHHFWHFVSEATEDLTHADSRLWQTLTALLFRPGFLTREFLEGRQARYLPPVRLYLVVSVIFFLIAGLQSRISNEGVILSYNGNTFNYQVVPARGAAGAGATARTPAKGAGGVVSGPAAVGSTPAARRSACEQSGAYVEEHLGWLAHLGPQVTQSCLTAFAEGGFERLNQAIEHNLERAMFVLLPLLALVMKPLYRKPPRYYIEHLLFFLHNHAFLFVVIGVSTLLNLVTSSRVVLAPVGLGLTIYVPIYFYMAMRRVYGQGPWRTIAKLVVLGAAYCFFGLLMLVATLSYSFLML